MVVLPREITTTILLTVFRYGEITMTQLQKETGFSTITVLNHVEEMSTANLLEERRETSLPKRRFLHLSKEGEQIASALNLLANSSIDSKALMDLGAKAGRLGAYREVVNLLRPQNVTRDYAIAELLVKDLEMLVESLTTIEMALPPEFTEKKENFGLTLEKLSLHATEARKHLQKNDIRRSVETVGLAWREYGKAGSYMESLLFRLKEKKLDELVKIIEFLEPKPISTNATG